MRSVLRIGTRSSALALAQARLVERSMQAAIAGLEIRIVTVRTTGDRIASAALAPLGGKGLFIKELEEALSDGRIDIAVHSMKDLPARLAPGFRIAATPRREDPRDVLVSRRGGGFDALLAHARVGTSSSRRRFEALRVRPDLAVVPLRGNVDTRLAKLTTGQVDAMVLAMAGLRRLGRADRVNLTILDEHDFVPAGGQGALAIEARSDAPAAGSWEVEAALGALNDLTTECEIAAERAFLATIGASCATAVGVKATLGDGQFKLRALLFDNEGKRSLADEIEAAAGAHSVESAAVLGAGLGYRMLERGAAELIGQ